MRTRRGRPSSRPSMSYARRVLSRNLAAEVMTRPNASRLSCTTRNASRQDGAEARIEHEFLRRRRGLEHLAVLRHVVERALKAGQLDLALAAINLFGDEIFLIDAIEDRVVALGIFRENFDGLRLVGRVPQPGM